jgi:hypothetical protein
MGQRLLGQHRLECRQLGRLKMKADRLSLAARAYIAAATLLSLGCAAMLWSMQPRAAEPLTFLSISALGMLAHAFPIRATRGQAYQVTLPFILVAAALFNMPQLIAFLVLIHTAEQFRLRRPLYIQLFNLCDYFLSALAAAVFFQRATAMLPSTTLSSVEAAMAAGCTFIVVNRLLLAGALWVARGISPLQCGLFKADLLAADLVIVWISGPRLVLTSQAGPLMVLVTAGPLCLARPALAGLLARRKPSIEAAPAKAA